MRVVARVVANVLLFLSFASINAVAAPVATTPILVELFTSEGCSDCPPADTFLRVLDSTQPIAGAQLIVMEEHVDYWDDQGWRDPFSSHAFTLRQESYVQRMRLASPYTPQMVVDGAYEFVGSARGKAGKIFETARSNAKVGVRVTSVKNVNGKITAHVEIDPAPANADVLAVLAAERAESQVSAGENRNTHLEHVAVVRSIESVGKIKKGQTFSRDVNLSAKQIAAPYRLIVFLQESGEGKILGAAAEQSRN